MQVLIFVDIFNLCPFQFGTVDPRVDNINGFNAHSVGKVHARNVVGVGACVGTGLGPPIGATKLLGGCGGGGGSREAKEKKLQTSQDQKKEEDKFTIVYNCGVETTLQMFAGGFSG